jgi:predicted dehydrogenase
LESIVVLIIGAGKIGAFFDRPGCDSVLTHAHAFVRHRGFRLAGFVDSNMEKAILAASIWGGRAFATIGEAFSCGEIDVVVVASPDETHHQVLEELLNYQVRLILAEKPLAKTSMGAEQIVINYEKSSANLMVNYTRRFIPEFIELRSQISKDVFGAFLSGTGYYGKGLYHNGSHMVDFLRFIFGEIESVENLGVVDDFYADDPSISACFKIKGGKNFLLNAVDCRAYTVFEMDLFFKEGRIRIIDSGFAIEKYNVTASDRFSGYQKLNIAEITETSFSQGLKYVAENAYEVLVSNGKALCTAKDGLAALQICKMIVGCK